MLRSIVSVLTVTVAVAAVSPKDVVKAIYTSFQAGDVKTFMSNLDDSFTYQSTSAESSPVCTTHGSKAEFMSGCVAVIGDALPGFKLTKIVELFGEGEDVYSRVEVTTTAGGPMYFGHHWKVSNGKAISFFDHVDSLMVKTVSDRAGETPLPATIVMQAYDYFAKRDMESFMKLLAPNFVFTGNAPKSMACSGPYMSPQAWMEGCISKIPETWPGFSVVPVHTFSEGAYVMVTVKATSDSGMDTYFGHKFKVMNGKIVEFYDFSDSHQQVTTAQGKKTEL